MSGSWHEHFNNNNPLVLELACGKGEYALGLARIHPDKNAIGVDIKGNRLWVGAKKPYRIIYQTLPFYGHRLSS
ncbi:class I SAM-dependent methyltransferase [Niabella hibiscisoli]|uniref:hypothetical protein n=1 Tax=Niabella hibiscisoli TaxID=1825928 RepID=UPI0021D40A6C|nr:hypothetical protein [Niabella hibiscisoli]